MKKLFKFIYEKTATKEMRFYREIDRRLELDPLEFSHMEPKTNNRKWWVFKSGEIKVLVHYCYGYSPFSASMGHTSIDVTSKMVKQVEDYFGRVEDSRKKDKKADFRRLVERVVGGRESR